MQNFEKKGTGETGLAHVLAAFGYSMAGARVLFGEKAARLELVLLAFVILVFAITGAALHEFAIMGGLFLAVVSIEALNTAVELVVDRLSPERSEFAKQAKDLGSFAVFCALVVFCAYALWVVVT